MGTDRHRARAMARARARAKYNARARHRGRDRSQVHLNCCWTRTRKREYSRIYHSTCDSAIKKGWTMQQAKARARDAAKQHVASQSF